MEGNLIARSVQFEQAAVADGDAEDVGSQVLQCGAAIADRFAEGLLGSGRPTPVSIQPWGWCWQGGTGGGRGGTWL
jgi:hypothetical protein